MKRSLLMALFALMFMPEAHAVRANEAHAVRANEAHASLEPASCESEVYGWTSKDLRQVTRQELARSFCAETNAVLDQIVPCLEDAYGWFGDVPQKGRRVELTFLTCSNVVQASEVTEYLLFDVNTKSRASSCLQKVWDENAALRDDERYQKAAETCLDVLAIAPEEHAENSQAAPEEETPTPPEQDEDSFGPQ